jgi:hypothetical protein
MKHAANPDVGLFLKIAADTDMNLFSKVAANTDLCLFLTLAANTKIGLWTCFPLAMCAQRGLTSHLAGELDDRFDIYKMLATSAHVNLECRCVTHATTSPKPYTRYDKPEAFKLVLVVLFLSLERRCTFT